MVNEQEVAHKISVALTGVGFYVGQRVRIIRTASNEYTGTVVTVIDPAVTWKGLTGFVEIDPPLNEDGIWHKDWIEPI